MTAAENLFSLTKACLSFEIDPWFSAALELFLPFWKEHSPNILNISVRNVNARYGLSNSVKLRYN